MEFKELELLVIQWAKEKGILEKATPLAQANKTLEEINELLEACNAQNKGLSCFYNIKNKLVDTKHEIKDAIGDVLVTIIIQSEMQGLRIEDCLQSAYDVISKRTGKIIDGQFVKDND